MSACGYCFEGREQAPAVELELALEDGERFRVVGASIEECNVRLLELAQVDETVFAAVVQEKLEHEISYRVGHRHFTPFVAKAPEEEP